jgi:ATP-binding cassette subfamily B protein
MVIDEVGHVSQSGHGTIFENGLLTSLVLACVFFLLNALTGSMGALFKEKQAYLVNDYIQNLIHRKTIHISYAYYEDANYQDIFFRAINEAGFRPSRVFHGMLGIFQNSITLALVLGVLMTLHWTMLPFLVLISIPIILFRLYHSKKHYALRQKQTEQERRVHYYNRLLTSKDFAKELRIFNLGGLFKINFNELRLKLRSKQLQLLKQKTLWETSVQLLATCFLLLVFGYIIFSTISGEITSGTMALYFLALHRGYAVLQDWLIRVAALFEDHLFLKYFFDFLAIEVETKQDQNTAFPAAIRKGISFKNVSFKYPNSNKWVLNDVTFDIRAGDTVAIVGTNGAGKTTLVKLLAGLYAPSSGTITVDDVNWQHLKRDELANNVSVIFQDFMLYNAPAKDNIWYGNINRPAEMKNIQKAAEEAGIHDLFSNLHRGYDTTLGTLFKNSEQLSRGEWQRTALARSFFNDSQFIILDEPTSSLDAFTEANLIKHFREITQNRTALIISHRLSTIKLAKQIIVLDGSRIAETGSHQELMHNKGVYYSMIQALKL